MAATQPKERERNKGDKRNNDSAIKKTSNSDKHCNNRRADKKHCNNRRITTCICTNMFGEKLLV